MLAWVDRGLCEVDQRARLPWCAWCTWLSCVYVLRGLSHCGEARFELENCSLRHDTPIIFSLLCSRSIIVHMFVYFSNYTNIFRFTRRFPLHCHYLEPLTAATAGHQYHAMNRMRGASSR